MKTKTIRTFICLILLACLSIGCSRSATAPSGSSTGTVSVQRSSASISRKPSSASFAEKSSKKTTDFSRTTDSKESVQSSLVQEIRTLRGVLEDLFEILQQKNGLYPECENSETAHFLVDQYINQDKIFSHDEPTSGPPVLRARLVELQALEDDVSLRLFYEPSCQALGEDTLGARDHSL